VTLPDITGVVREDTVPGMPVNVWITNELCVAGFAHEQLRVGQWVTFDRETRRVRLLRETPGGGNE